MNTTFEPFQIERCTDETVCKVRIEPRRETSAPVELPNRLLGHFLDHMLKAAGVTMVVLDVAWPGSWRFDHVLCEDFGQIVGRAVAEMHDKRSTAQGVTGRGNAVVCMDECRVACTLSLEGRPRCTWAVEPGRHLDGFVDAWYDEKGVMVGQSTGTNLRQFFDGFTVGAKATLQIDVQQSGNLHHLYEAAFRAIGDAVGQSVGLGTGCRIPGDRSGFAGNAEYRVARENRE